MAQTPTAVRFPPGMLDDITDAAEAAGVARNAWIVMAVREKLGGTSAPVVMSQEVMDRAQVNPSSLGRSAKPKAPDAVTVEDDQDAFEVQWRQVASRVQWRVTAGGVEYAGAVSFKRDVLPAARGTLERVLGHPVQVSLAR